jgi:ABC-type Co2+ transport system permease subunit
MSPFCYPLIIGMSDICYMLKTSAILAYLAVPDRRLAKSEVAYKAPDTSASNVFSKRSSMVHAPLPTAVHSPGSTPLAMVARLPGC